MGSDQPVEDAGGDGAVPAHRRFRADEQAERLRPECKAGI